ncbi:MAG: MFS transporter [Ruminococcus sp.]|nr:MFS transporter [Ruminococcus sp.]
MKETLRNRLYIKILVSDLISNFGDILYYLALLNYVLQIEQSNFAIAIINASEIIPILFSFLLGYFADQNRKRVAAIIKTLVVRIAVYLFVAIIIGFKPSLFIVMVVSFANFISDLAGQYENSLYYPISNQLVRDEVREEVMAFRQSLTMSLNILFQAVGGVLICYISFRHLAMINAFTFAVSMMIVVCSKTEMRKYCQNEERAARKEKQSMQQLFRHLKKELVDAVKLLWKIPGIKETLAAIPVLNAGLAVVTSIVVLHMAENPAFCVISAETTIALVAICETAGRIVGSTLTIFTFKKMKLTDAVKIILLFIIILFSGIIVYNIYIVLAALFIASLLTGCVDPKMGALIFKNLDKTKLATAFGGMTTYFQLGDIVSKILFSILVMCFATKTIAGIYILITVLFLGYIIFQGKKK